MQRRIGLAVPTPIETIPLCLPTGGRDRTSPAAHREAGFTSRPLGILSGGDDEFAGILDPDPFELKQAGGKFLNERADEPVEFRDLVVEFQNSSR
jgi:hypothetical protein